MKKWLCAGLALAMMVLCGFAFAQENLISMDEQVDRIFRETKTVGGAFLVAQHGEIVYEHYLSLIHI